jgi:hypothetical protein
MPKSARKLKEEALANRRQRAAFSRFLAEVLATVLLLLAGFWLVSGWSRLRKPSGMSLTEPLPPASHTSFRQPSEPRIETVAAATSPERPANPLRRNLAVALEALQAELDPMEQAQKLASLVQTVAAADLPEAVAFLNEQPPTKLGRALELRLLRQWAGNDPQTAANWVSQGSLGAVRPEAINAVAVVWANQNLSEAAQWLRQLPGEAEQAGALVTAAYEAARTQPVEALKLASEVPAGEPRNDLIIHAASQWAAQAPADAAEWASRIPDSNLRQRVLAEVATAWGESDPMAAATFAAQTLAPGKPQSDAVVGVVQRWAPKEPAAAAAWVAEFPAGTLRDTALQELAKLQPEQSHAGSPEAGVSSQR